MKQVELIRNYVRNRFVPTLRAWISCLPDTELEALTRLQDPRTTEAIADHVLNELGHETHAGGRPPKAKPRGRPPKNKLQPTVP